MIRERMLLALTAPILACVGLTTRALTAPPPASIPGHDPTVDVSRTSGACLDDWDAFLKLPMTRRPWIEWQEPEWRSEHLNVDTDDLGWSTRRTVPENKGSPCSIWCFGDSQVFGDWLSDEQTIPSRLAGLTEARVTNHGHCGHTSAQAVALLQSLLREGRRPGLAILFSTQNEGASDDRPVLGFGSHPTPEAAVRRWRVAWEQFAASGVKTLLVLVPLSYAHDELDRWRRLPEVLPRNMRDRARAEEALLEAPEGALDLRDGFSRFEGAPIVDACHFSAGFDQWIAERVAERVR